MITEIQEKLNNEFDDIGEISLSDKCTFGANAITVDYIESYECGAGHKIIQALVEQSRDFDYIQLVAFPCGGDTTGKDIRKLVSWYGRQGFKLSDNSLDWFDMLEDDKEYEYSPYMTDSDHPNIWMFYDL